MVEGETDRTDFTMTEYRLLLRLAKAGGYRFSAYTELPLDKRCILWRHDIDMSLNRAVRMAEVEAEERVRSTFFIYLHSEFYNIMEAGQLSLAKKLIELGGSIGLHFNPSFHSISDEFGLDYWIKKEADVLRDLLDIEVPVFSFHDTNPFILTCEKNTYGGLINCYSSYFKKEVSYCSDSNGVWAHRRLRDVLTSAVEPHLHVLTHPEWWQDTPMEPREKVFRCADGRARKVVAAYVKGVAAYGRPDNFSMGNHFRRLESRFPTRGEALEIQWLQGERVAVFLELWRHFERDILDSCRLWFKNALGANPVDVECLLVSDLFRLRSNVFFLLIHGQCWNNIVGDHKEFLQWRLKRDSLVHGAQEDQKSKLDQGVKYLIEAASRLAEFMGADSTVQSCPVTLLGGIEGASGANTLSVWLETHASTIRSTTELQSSYPPGTE